MNTFLEYVAEDLLQKHGTNLSGITVVFPNKRASLFLNDHLARRAGQPLWSPAYTTISSLFAQHSQLRVADSIKLVCELHQSFTAMTGIDETLDHFYGWGQLLLADFDDIDKQMADAVHVFANLSDLHEMDDDSFLTDEQRQVIRRFFSHFSDAHNSELKERFLRLWNRMGSIYEDFKKRLAKQGIAYEGMLYRDVVNNLDCSALGNYIFVGFNVLLRVEQRLFALLHHEGKARFYWDFDAYYMSQADKRTNGQTTNEAGYFVRQYLDLFPNELDNADSLIYDNFSRQKQLHIVSATTENIQARYATTWLRQHGSDAGSRTTAVVLCNEGLLPTLIHCLPQEVESVNITMGYPLGQSPAASLVGQLIKLRRDGYDHQRNHFRLRYVKGVLRHPYVMQASPQAATLLKRLTDEKVFFPTTSQLAADPLCMLLFQQPPALLNDNASLLTWIADVVQAIATTPTSAGSERVDKLQPLKEESLFRTYTLLNRLLSLVLNDGLHVDIITMTRLIDQLMSQTTVPFHGEPAEGLQVMGLLETRNLDFSHVLILSANEGNLPQGINDTSFIPYTLRKAYGLTTQDHRVAIYSYYFHRLLQRADDVTIVYNSATSDMQKGQMSRFLLQLMVESPHTITFHTLQGLQATEPKKPQPVENRALLPGMLSPTAINRYLTCPLRFHYYYVCGLHELDETDDDTIDNRIFGNIFHEASRMVYSRLRETSDRIMPADIDYVLKHPVYIERAVDQAISQELFHAKPGKQRPIADSLNGLQLINRAVIIHYLRQLLTIDRQLAPFTILDLEGLVSMDIEIHSGMKVNIGGRIDRLDMVTDADGREHIRVVDYKTGAHRLKPLPDVDSIFVEENQEKKKAGYYLQTLLYSIIVAAQHPEVPVSPALLFIQHAGQEGYNPILKFGNEPISDICQYEQPFTDQLRQVVSRMFDPDTPLQPTTVQAHCDYCPYRLLCHK